MKSDREDNLNMIRSDVWLDTDSLKSGEKPTQNHHPMAYEDIEEIESSERFEEEEEKGDVFYSFIEALKNKEDTAYLTRVLQDFKDELHFKQRDTLIYLIILFERKDLYKPITEAFEDVTGLEKDNFVDEELPESIDELLTDDHYMSQIKITSLQNALDGRYRSALN